MIKINPSEITPEHVYLSRRAFLKSMGVISASAAVLAACGGRTSGGQASNTAGEDETDPPTAGTDTDELGNPLNSFEDITHYNNYYEFTLEKEDVAKLSRDLITSPWMVTVGGLVHNPKTFDVDNLRKMFDQEERIYRLRCVEAWSMVIPWTGFPLARLLEEVEPKAGAKYVRFETLLDPEQMPRQKGRWYNWPYVEGLHIDEAMNELATLAMGLYGKNLLPQNGAPVRLVVPWKYGFKSIKSIVKIDLSAEMPTSFWMNAAPHEYGFFANVNPNEPHPRWSQSTERRIGELGRRPTLMFNGYEEEVSHLYEEGTNLQIKF